MVSDIWLLSSLAPYLFYSSFSSLDRPRIRERELHTCIYMGSELHMYIVCGHTIRGVYTSYGPHGGEMV